MARAMVDPGDGAVRQDTLLVRRDGTDATIEDSIAPIHAADGRVCGAVMVFRDVTASRHIELRLAHLAHHDALTGLPNRTLLQDRVEQAIGRARRQGTRVGVLFVDLDRFKRVNNYLGHATGDLILQGIAQRLTSTVRATDTVSRRGGDEFIVLMPDIADAHSAGLQAERILDVLAPPHAIHGKACASPRASRSAASPRTRATPTRSCGHPTPRLRGERALAATNTGSSSGRRVARPRTVYQSRRRDAEGPSASKPERGTPPGGARTESYASRRAALHREHAVGVPDPQPRLRLSSDGAPQTSNGRRSNTGRRARNSNSVTPASGASRRTRSSSSVASSGPCTIRPGIALDLGDVAAVVVDAVAVEGQRRVAEQQHLVGDDRALPRRRRRAAAAPARRRPARGLAIDDVVELRERRRVAPLRAISWRTRTNTSVPLRPPSR